MTLLELKKETMALIEELKGTIDAPGEGKQSEITDDPDIAAKLNYVINNIQFELAQIKRISDKTTFTYTDSYEFDLPVDFYQVDKINCDYNIYGNKIILDTTEDSVDMYYFKYPKVIDNDTADDYELELTPDCLNAMPYGIASDILKSDISVDYGVYANRYNELKNGLRLSDSSPRVFIDATNAINE